MAAFAGIDAASAEAVVATAPPDGGADPVLAAHGPAIARGRLRHAIYLSTTGVYGDCAGAWVDEATAPRPMQPRSVLRLAAERAWAALALPEGAPQAGIDLCRVSAIYGPGRSALDELRAGRGRRIDKPGHVFSRIHRDDIARAVLAALAHPPAGVRVLHLADDEPAEPRAVTEEAARLLAIAPPPLLSFAEAARAMSPLALSFWRERRRISAAATKAVLRIGWRYPTYRDGLAAIAPEQAGRPGETAVIGQAGPAFQR